jgi:hypothetical protein
MLRLAGWVSAAVIAGIYLMYDWRTATAIVLLLGVFGIVAVIHHRRGAHWG